MNGDLPQTFFPEPFFGNRKRHGRHAQKIGGLGFVQRKGTMNGHPLQHPAVAFQMTHHPFIIVFGIAKRISERARISRR